MEVREGGEGRQRPKGASLIQSTSVANSILDVAIFFEPQSTR